MTAGAPWSVKGIDPKAREVAKDLARRSGMTLGEWLNRVILEDDGEPAPAEPVAQPPQRLAAEPPRPYLVSETAAPRPDELGRVAHALDRLTDRIEASETRTGLAISGVEHSVRQAVARIEATEREHVAVAARFEGAVDRVGDEQARLAERLRRMESEAAGPRSAEALRALEQSVSRVAGHVYEAEARTRDGLVALESRLARAESSAAGDPAQLMDEMLRRLGQRLAEAEGQTADALESLRCSLGALDGRLCALEGGEAQEQRFQALASDLTRQVEAARAQVAERLKATDAGRVDQRFAELAAQVKAAEQRSAQAIQRMGREVLSMAETLNTRVQASEERSAAAIAQVGGEMARVAGAVDSRLGRAEQVQSEALEKLSAEIGRITERMLVAERRAADAIDDVGVQVTRVSERMEERQERVGQDLAEKIRQSEERTAQLLAETRDRLELRLGEPSAHAAEPPATAAFGPELFSRAELEDDLPPLAELVQAAALRSRDEAAEAFAPIPEPEDDLFDLDQPEPPAEGEAQPSLSTREVIDQARAAARAAAQAEPRERLQVKARASWRAGGRPSAGLFSSLRPRRAPGSTLQTALMVAGGAAFLSVGAAGVVLMQGSSVRPTQTAALEQPPASPRAAVALAPQALGPVAPAPAEPVEAARPPAQLADALGAAYVSAVKGVESGEGGALARLKAIAEAGHPPAQLYLGKLYEAGRFGVKRNLPEARRWTARAAEGGDAAAMHNLALYDFRGEGGPQDLASAARWFRRAADQGVVDSQYNLGLLYQSGSGVERDLPAAYRWFAIAAQGGDAQARANAGELARKLSPQQLAAADQAVAAFRAREAQPAAGPSGAATGPTVAAAQRILGRLGYYKGPADGAATPQTQAAVAAYQRSEGLAATGALDAATVASLSVFNR